MVLYIQIRRFQVKLIHTDNPPQSIRLTPTSYSETMKHKFLMITTNILNCISGCSFWEEYFYDLLRNIEKYFLWILRMKFYPDNRILEIQYLANVHCFVRHFSDFKSFTLHYNCDMSEMCWIKSLRCSETYHKIICSSRIKVPVAWAANSRRCC